MVNGYIEIEASSNACYDARSRTFSSCSGQYDSIFYAPADGIIEGVKLVHNTGAVQCYTYYHNYYTLSNWGLCDHVGVIIMSINDETNYLGNILYPVNGRTDGLYYWFAFPSAVNDNAGTIPNSYEISGYNQESNYLIFMNPKYNVSKMDKFMLQYTEAYVQSSHSDNVGVGYASIYFLYANPTIQTTQVTQLTLQPTTNNPTTNTPTTNNPTTNNPTTFNPTTNNPTTFNPTTNNPTTFTPTTNNPTTFTPTTNNPTTNNPTTNNPTTNNPTTNTPTTFNPTTNTPTTNTPTTTNPTTNNPTTNNPTTNNPTTFNPTTNNPTTNNPTTFNPTIQTTQVTQVTLQPTTNKHTTNTPTTNAPTTNTRTTSTKISSHSPVATRMELSIEITCVPPYGSGSSSWGTINGKCNCVGIVNNISEIACDESNIDWSTRYSVVIYSITDKHYIQPHYDDYYTTISNSGLWSRAIHLGYEYQVNLVDFEDRYGVIDTDMKHDPECNSPGANSTSRIVVYSSLLSVFVTLLLLLML